MEVSTDNGDDTLLATTVKICIALNVVWALVVPSLCSVLASHGLTSTGFPEIDDLPTVSDRWALTFVFSYESAMFVLALTAAAVYAVIKILAGISQNDRALRSAFEASSAILLVFDLCLATMVATFAPEVLTHFGFSFGVVAFTSHSGAALLWIATFLFSLVFSLACSAALIGAALIGAFVLGLFKLISTAMRSCS